MDLRDLISRRVRDALKDIEGGVNVAAAVNVGTDGHHTAVYSDDEVTIVQRDGETTVSRRSRDERDGRDGRGEAEARAAREDPGA